MLASEILLAAKEQIGSPDRWTQNSYAAGKTGSPVLMQSHKACRFCVAGAITRALDSYDTITWHYVVNKEVQHAVDALAAETEIVRDWPLDHITTVISEN